MSDLTDFLLARIAEDGAVAREAASHPPIHSTRWQLSTVKVETIDGMTHRTPRGTVEARPARVLAECEAKRRIVEALVGAEQAVAGYDNDDPNNPPSYWQEWGNHHALRLAAESLALPYADHPDYREEWRP